MFLRLFQGIIHMLQDWPMGTVVGLMFLIALSIVTYIAVLEAFRAVDSWFQSPRCGEGTAISKEFVEATALFAPTYGGTTSVNVTQETFYPAAWSILVDFEGTTHHVPVSKLFYESVQAGEPLMVEFIRGRFSDKPYIKHLGRRII